MVKYELTVSVEIPENFGSFQEIEQKILAARNQAGLKLLEQVLAGYENQYFLKRKASKKDRRKKDYQTLLGEMEFKRWRAKKGDRKGCYPLDEWIGVNPRQKVSPSLGQEIIRQCVQKPYAKGSEDLEKLTGVLRSAQANWRYVQAAGEKLASQEICQDWEQEGLPQLREGAKDPCPILGIDPDATYVRPRRKLDKRHEIKLAVLYRSKDSVKKCRGKLRYGLGQKQVVVGKVNGDARALFQRVTQKAVKEYGAHQETRTICHGDGDPWIKRLKSDYMPQTLNRLDPYHVFEKIHLATGLKEIPSHWMEDFYANPERLIKKISRLKREMASPEDKTRIGLLVTYLKNNKAGMEPSGVPKEIKAQYPRMYLRGSGTIETNVDWLVGTRFKRSRMNWSATGLNNLLRLREAYLNKSMDFKRVTLDPNVHRKSYASEIRELLRES